MALSIKQPEASMLADELASETSEDATTAMTVAIRERLAKLEQKQDQRREDLRAIVEELRPLLKDAPNSWDIDELLYDERGLPK